MKLYRAERSLKKRLSKEKKQGKTIGFVPTMGALHAGHASLIDQSVKKADVTVCSIFVNPTQFNEASDLKKYPRTVKKDSILLESVGCDILFNPGVKTIYPPGLDTTVDLDLGKLDKVMEGEFREGHFDGVAQVVKRLLDIVEPDYLFMGQKDFQQFTIIQHMINVLKISTDLVVCPIKREADGLAMSSRNVRLEDHIRPHCSNLHKTLLWAKKQLKKVPKEVQAGAMKRLNSDHFRPEYFKIVDGYTLQEVKDFSKHDYIVACLAVWAGEVRLIDNMILKQQ